MPNDLNNCQFTGRLGKEVETRYSAGGMAVSKFSMAVGSIWKDKNSGEKQEKTIWIDVVAFGKLAEIMGEYLSKGSKVLITGEYSVSKWQDDQGNNRQRTEIVASYMQMLDSRGNQSDQQAQQNAPQQQRQQPVQQQAQQQQYGGQQQGGSADFGGGGEFLDDDIPF